MIGLIAPVPESHFRSVWELLQEFSFETLDSASPTAFEEFCAKAKRDEQNGGASYSVMAPDGGFAGAVWFENVGDNIGMGHLVFDRHKITPQEKAYASRLALDKAFHAGFRKIIWQLFSDNRRFASFISKRLGAIHEGTLRQQVRRGNQYVDMDLYASFPEAA